MSGERAKRFPLALEDLKREPRKPEGRAAERQAAGDAARQRLIAAAAAAPAATAL
ncbi:protein-L-isoaspartate O-methyltransferase, partial [Burkholderia thailandensis]